MRTGWFGRPGTYRFTRTHVVSDTDPPRPICHSRIGRRMAFQWSFNGVSLRHVDCRRCLARVARETVNFDAMEG